MRYFLFSLLTLISLELYAQDHPEYAAFLIPDSIRKNANDVYLQHNKRFKVKSLKSGIEEVDGVVTILNDNSHAHYVSVLYDNDTKVKYLEAKIYDKLGKFVRKIDKDEIQDQSASESSSLYIDTRYRFINAQHTDYPYTIAYSYKRELEGRQFHDYPEWFIDRINSGYMQSSFTIETPNNLPFYHKMYNLEIEPVIVEDDNKQKYTWEVHDIPPIKNEEFSGSISEKIPLLLISPHLFKYDSYQGGMKDWQQYGNFVADLWEGRDVLPKEAKAIVQELTKELTTDREKIAVLYQYLQSQMRYVSIQLGIGGYQPFDAKYVWKNKYGDCKALTNFMKGMLKEVGITSYPSLIYSGDPYVKIEEDFVNPVFNHVILYVPDSETWLECTSSSAPVNYIGSGTEGKKVLLIKPNGSELYNTKEWKAHENKKTSSTSIVLSDKGAAIVKAKLHASGLQQESFRGMDNLFSQKELEEYFLEHNDFPSPHIHQIKITSSNEKAEANMYFHLQVPKYASKAGRRLFLPVNLVNPYNYIPPENEERIYPIHYDNPKLWQDTITIEIPDTYSVEGIPQKELKLDAGFATYDMKIEQVGNRLRYVRVLEMKREVLPPEQYNEFRDFFKQVTKTEKMKIVLAKKRT